MSILDRILFRHKGATKSQPPQWVCGRLQSGQPCRPGPTGGGRCQGSYRCMPQKTLNGWVCRRPAKFGGTCDRGPRADGACGGSLQPCKPKRTPRAERELYARAAAVIAFAGVLIAILMSASTDYLMPGPMTVAHNAIGQCSTCHTNVADGRTGWIKAVFAPTDPGRDSEACASCHQMEAEPLNPHGAATNVLQAKTENMRSVAANISAPQSALLRQIAFPMESNQSGNVFCATCHQEHLGTTFDLKEMANAACHTCHVAKFDNFSTTHPDFGEYPFRRRTRIIFDHASHFTKHFPEIAGKNDPSKQAPDSCINCHKTGADKKLMDIKPFAQTCASCHLDQITGVERATGPKGVAMLALPGIDVRTLRERNADIGQWPEESEAPLTPLMKLLIGWNDERRRMLIQVNKLDLLDLQSASDAEIEAVTTLVWEVKGLFHALATSKTSDVMTRLSAAIGRPVDAKLLAELTASMPRDVLIGAQREWLPALDAEMTARGNEEWTLPIAIAAPPQAPPADLSSSVATRNAAPAPAPGVAASTVTIAPQRNGSEATPAPAGTTIAPKRNIGSTFATPTGQAESVAPRRSNATSVAPSAATTIAPARVAPVRRAPAQAAPAPAVQAPAPAVQAPAPAPAAVQAPAPAAQAPAAAPAQQPLVNAGPRNDELLEDDSIPADDLLLQDDARNFGQRGYAAQDELIEKMRPPYTAWKIDSSGNLVRLGEQANTSGQNGARKPIRLAQAGGDDSILYVIPGEAAKEPGGEDILEGGDGGAPAPVNNAAPASPAVEAAPQPQPAIAADQPDGGNDDGPAPQPQPPVANAAIAPVDAPGAVPQFNSDIDAESWAEYGGWYRQDFAILYRPRGHQDDFIKAWLNFTAPIGDADSGNPNEYQVVAGDTLWGIAKRNSIAVDRLITINRLTTTTITPGQTLRFSENNNNANAAASVFNLLADKDAQGQCSKCHSIDGDQRNGRAVNWKPKTMANKKGAFTKFVHEPHFPLLGKEGCLTCHKFNPEAKYAKTFEGGNPSELASNFIAVKRNDCATCHNKQAERQDCLLCHQYHVNGVSMPMMKTQIPK